MPLGPKDPETRKRAWLTAGFAAAGLLFMPFLVWLILPAPPKIALPLLLAATYEAPPPRARPTFSPQPASAPVEVTKPAEEPTAGAVRGRVMGPDGRPVGRAWVGCNERDTSTVSDHDGSFELPTAAVGCVAVARKAGFGTSASVTLKAGDERNNTFELKGGGRIEGVVVDEKGNPVPKFMLAVEKFIGAEGDDEGSNGRARTVENDKGQFTMESVTPGKYMLSVSAEGRPPAKSETMEVEPGRSVTGVRIVLAKGALLSGKVTDAGTRQPIAGARVALDSITSSGVSSIPSVKSDESGAYTLEGVPVSGPFSIRVDKDGYRARIVSGLQTRGSAQITSDVQLQPLGDGVAGDSELAGIGAILGPAPSSYGVLVIATTPDGPAARAGLQRLDWIIRIDGESTESLTLVDCIQRLRGEAGTRVSVSLKRGTQELVFNLTRAVVVR
jgi:hypothetical protein